MRRDRFDSDAPLTPTRPVQLGAHEGHSHVVGWTRRRFLQASAGTAAVGAVVGAGLIRPGAAQAGGPGIGLAEPIPATVEFFPGVFSHVQFPPVLGGALTVDNLEVQDFVVATNICGQIHQQVLDLPPGTPIAGVAVEGLAADGAVPEG